MESLDDRITATLDDLSTKQQVTSLIDWLVINISYYETGSTGGHQTRCYVID